MFKNVTIRKLLDTLFNSVSTTSPEHYTALRRNIVITMLVITLMPLASMTVINHFQYRTYLRKEIRSPILNLANKTKHSFELFLKERLSTLRFIAAAYSYDELNDEQNLRRIFSYLRKELGGFVDLGLITASGDMVSYAGPYTLLGKNYSDQISFQETQIKGQYISNVFMGHRKFPHIVISVQHLTEGGQSWILRATIDTDQFDNLIKSMGLDDQSNAFLVDNEGIMQTNSKYYGNILEPCRLNLPKNFSGSEIFESTDSQGRSLLVAMTSFTSANYVLVIVKPRTVVLKSWYALKSDLLIVFAVSVTVIMLVVIRITGVIVRRIRQSDERRETALTELQHNQKLSSIGRLAAGVAHEINNPLAIINEKAGLMNDLIEFSDDFKNKEKFGQLTDSVIQSVDRCRKITHRLLGFARRLDIQMEPMNVNSVIREVTSFLEREAVYRKIDLRLKLDETLHLISSDKGQIQQVFLNLLTNAFAAVEDKGIITVVSSNLDEGEGIRVDVSDNGCGIPETIIKNIFDPFFSTKKEKGTGLGLSITYGIVKKLNGSITVKSREGEGTTFSVILPVEPPTSSEEKNDPDTH